MARGRRTSLTIRLTAQERRTLQAWQWSTTIPVGHQPEGIAVFAQTADDLKPVFDLIAKKILLRLTR